MIVQAPAFPVEELRLDNGLLLLTREMRSSPVVSVFAWYRVGGRDDPEGRTGLSHWVEHMLFKASRAFPTGEIPRLLSSRGAQFNGFTWSDYTACFATLPSDALELSLRIEADRLAYSLIDSDAIERERAVLLAERAGDERTPSALLRERTLRLAFGPHPYGRPLAGTRDDLLAAHRDEVFDHYRTWYRPNNFVLVVVGDIDTARVRERVAASFGNLPPGALPSRRSAPTSDDAVVGERRVIVEAPAIAPLLEVALPIPAASDHDYLPATILATLLGGGRRSRLHRALVAAGFAAGVSATAGLAREPHALTIDVTLWPGGELAQAESIVLEELDRMSGGAGSDEVDMAKRSLHHAFLLGTEGSSNQARLLGRYEMASSYRDFEHYLDRLEAVRADDINRVAGQLLGRPRWTVGWLVPEPNGSRAAAQSGPVARGAEHLHP